MKHLTINRIGDIRVQVDRWPITDTFPKPSVPHVLTMICVAMYDREPSKREMIQALSDAIEILKDGK